MPRALLAAALAAVCACGAEAPPLRVFAAASIGDVVDDLARGFEGAPVKVSVGASSVLARQIREGAPADVFVSASRAWMDFLREADALAGAPVAVARNQLVCIAPGRGPRPAGGARSLDALVAALAPADRIAIADEGVPAGEYARSALEHAGRLGAVRARLVGQKDVRAVLHAVEQGDVQAGFVYATDARIADVEVLFALDPATHPQIEVQAAALRGARHPAEARRFLDHLRGEAARERLAGAGFVLP